MSDLRFDPITGYWVAIATNRRNRPNEFNQVLQRRHPGPCPFCLGNEKETPEPLTVVDGKKDQWLVRVVPNKFPSFPSDPQNGFDSGSSVEQPFASVRSQGLQEVIIHSHRHVESLSELTACEIEAGFSVLVDRVRSIQQTPGIEHAMLFMNCRPEAGASLQHIHSQLIGTPFIPDQLRSRWQRLSNYQDGASRSMMEAVLDWEIEQQSRVVETTEHFTVLCPFASRFGYQVWIVPNRRDVEFARLSKNGSDELAELCKKYVGRIEQRLSNPAYNMLYHFAPREFSEYDHWFVEIFPRLNRLAGFEWGTGWWVNPYSPEDVARELRS